MDIEQELEKICEALGLEVVSLEYTYPEYNFNFLINLRTVESDANIELLGIYTDDGIRFLEENGSLTDTGFQFGEPWISAEQYIELYEQLH